MPRIELLGETTMGQPQSRRLGDQLFEAFDAACEAENGCLAFCLFEALMIELSDRDGDRRHPQWKVDMIVQATLRNVARPLPGLRHPIRKSAELILFPQSARTKRRRQSILGSVEHMRSYR